MSAVNLIYPLASIRDAARQAGGLPEIGYGERRYIFWLCLFYNQMLRY